MRENFHDAEYLKHVLSSWNGSRRTYRPPRTDPQGGPVDEELKRLQERLDNQAQASMDLVDALARVRAWREQYGCQLMHDADAALGAILDGA